MLINLLFFSKPILLEHCLWSVKQVILPISLLQTSTQNVNGRSWDQPPLPTDLLLFMPYWGYILVLFSSGSATFCGYFHFKRFQGISAGCSCTNQSWATDICSLFLFKMLGVFDIKGFSYGRTSDLAFSRNEFPSIFMTNWILMKAEFSPLQLRCGCIT